MKPVFWILFVFGAAAVLDFGLMRAETPEEWDRIGEEELRKALEVKLNTKKAKNIIFFLGDGMGISTLTAGRIYKGQQHGHNGEEGSLVFEEFPHMGLAKTYNDNYQTPDSAGTATAYFCGQKAAMGVIGVDSTVRLGDCNSATKDHAITSILEWAQDAGKATGLVTTTRITHATPAATYAHSPDRDWEADADVPAEDRRQCADIAKQMIDNNPGRRANVIFGGGLRKFTPNNELSASGSGKKGYRLDGQNLFRKWKTHKIADGLGDKAHSITTRDQLSALTPENTDYVLGLFSDDHLEYELKRNRTSRSQPSLTEMTRKAIELLSKHEQGFFLAVEGGRIDHAHHDGKAKLSLHELLEFDNAISNALKMVPLEDTLIVVTADHSHTLNIVGYPERGNSILKLAGKDKSRLPYTTLSYANGPGAITQLPRRDLTHVDTEHEDFQQEALISLSSESHGGEDVAIYARGPFAHLFHTLHEQNYIAHAMDYAGCYRKRSGAHCKVTDDVEEELEQNIDSNYRRHGR
ncbi:alkaline phosphatase-like [Paramacrobiotus metropolitanus]|uniref:alkaline phosphatase-like n=1 Tax=Paramacrobiotus metropolitanus TaxID=2943436 RepID=UPI00244628CC|nr:alkaline phosphatase-like [Paramacrobiotus metropolitanus]